MWTLPYRYKRPAPPGESRPLRRAHYLPQCGTIELRRRTSLLAGRAIRPPPAGFGCPTFFNWPALPKQNNCINGGCVQEAARRRDFVGRVERGMSGLEKRRPLSPHLQIYRPMLTMVMPIAHRITGAALYLGTLLLAWFLIAVSIGGGTYDSAAYC